jgi:hypothetical protein
MSALAKRCSTSSEACVHLCRRATSPAKRMRSTRRSRRLRKDTGRGSRLRLPLLRRRPRLQLEGRTLRLRRPLRRPLPQSSPQSRGRLRPRRQGPLRLRLDRLHKRDAQAKPGPQTRPFQAQRSGLRRRRRNAVRHRRTHRNRRARPSGGRPRAPRRQLRPLDPSWLLQWPTSPPSDPGPAGRPHPAGRRAARMRVYPDWRR